MGDPIHAVESIALDRYGLDLNPHSTYTAALWPPPLASPTKTQSAL
jgi:hypothetical protein